MAGENKFIRSFPKIVLFGDSLIQFSFGNGGFGAAIADHFQRKCDVLNRGFSGYTTASDKLILPELLKNDNNPPGSILAAVILLGSNDSEDVDFEHTRYVAVPEYKANLTDICQQFMKAGVPFDKQILITPPIMHREKWQIYCEEQGFQTTMGKTNTKEHAKACLEVGKALDIDVFDLWTDMQKFDNWKDLLEDGLHLSREGNKLVSETLLKLLDRKLPNLLRVFPDWQWVHPHVSKLKSILDE